MKRISVFPDTRWSVIAAERVCTVAAVCLAAVLVSGCKKKQEAAAPPPTVEVTKVVQKDVPIKKEWVGTLDGYVNAIIRPQITGYLIKQNYQEGQFVKKGQVLFLIDPRTFKAAFDEAKAQLAQQRARHDVTKANLARIRPLAEKNAVSRKDLDDAIGAELSTRSSVEGAKAAVETARLNMEFTRITSPVDGIPGIAKAQLGDLVSPDMPNELTTVSTVNPIKAYINVSEQEYLKVKGSRQKAEQIPLQLVLADGSVYPHEGHLVLADRQIDPTTGTLRVGSLFPNPGNKLRPGGYALVRGVMSVKKGALLVPQRAVTDMQGKPMVAVVGADNKVDVRSVQVAERIGSDWIITSGLKPGDKVVVEGTQKVKPGMTVVAQEVSSGEGSGAAAGGSVSPATQGSNTTATVPSPAR